eukprot:scaffold34612_cov86-Skeletonema_dohrnii-CCMP3373.AAC.2
MSISSLMLQERSVHGQGQWSAGSFGGLFKMGILILDTTEFCRTGGISTLADFLRWSSLSHRSLCKSLGPTFGSNQIVNRTTA